MFLESLGATAAVLRAFESIVRADLVLARVARGYGDRYQLLGENLETAAEPSGSLRYRAETAAEMPVVGDWVGARIAGPGEALIEEVLPRRSLFSRRAAGNRGEQQPVAANIDVAFLVCGLDGDFNLRRIERYLALAAASGAQAVVVLNKADLCEELVARIGDVAAVAGAAPIETTSAVTGEGVEGLRRHLLRGVTGVLLGSSGAGKSSLINSLMGEQRLRTAAVRPSDSRGRHTTTHRELLLMPGGGVLIDTPGMRELGLWAETESVETVFVEITELARCCRFGDCTHGGEPGCAVEEAVRAGAVTPERWQSYLKLMREARYHEETADKLAATARKRRDRQIHRAQRQHYKLDR
jgi:ribosome biogenesis GTPase / thiamine phosphate phosphatase